MPHCKIGTITETLVEYYCKETGYHIIFPLDHSGAPFVIDQGNQTVELAGHQVAVKHSFEWMTPANQKFADAMVPSLGSPEAKKKWAEIMKAADETDLSKLKFKANIK